MDAIITIIFGILNETGFSHIGAFTRWLLGGCKKRYSDIYTEKGWKNGLIGLTIVIVLPVLSFVYFL